MFLLCIIGWLLQFPAQRGYHVFLPQVVSKRTAHIRLVKLHSMKKMCYYWILLLVVRMVTTVYC